MYKIYNLYQQSFTYFTLLTSLLLGLLDIEVPSNGYFFFFTEQT